MRKRGLSAVVTTLIIILLVLVAVGVIWVVVRNIVESGAEQIELGQFTLNLEIESVQVEAGNVTIIVVRRNSGEGEFVGMNFVFSDGRNSEIIKENSTIDQLDTKTFTFILSEIDVNNLKSVSIYPIFKLGYGKETFGNPSDIFEVKGTTGTGGVVSEAYGGAFEELGLIGRGRSEYTISADSSILPEFKTLVVDPLDVLPGDNQTFTATVYSPDNVTNVTTRTQLDNKIFFLPLEKISDDGAGTSTWSATWTVYDTHIETYRTNFTATDSAGNVNSASLTWTDAECGFTHGGNSDLFSSCIVTAMSGGDNSDITLSSGVVLTVESGGTVAYAPGYGISPGSGSIAFNGGVIKKGYLFYVDLDLDGYTDGTTLVYDTSSSKAGHRRASDGGILGSSDCQDSGGGSFFVQTNVGSLGLDVDQDRYTTGTSTTRCVGVTPSSYWYRDTSGTYKWITTGDDLGTGNDCLDSSSAVNPGITAWFTTSGPNGWDYNCVSGEEKQYSGSSNRNCGNPYYYTNPGWECTSLFDQGNGVCGCTSATAGWDGAEAACGATANYINTNSCPGYGPGCPSSRTQGCR